MGDIKLVLSFPKLPTAPPFALDLPRLLAVFCRNSKQTLFRQDQNNPSHLTSDKIADSRKTLKWQVCGEEKKIGSGFLEVMNLDKKGEKRVLGRIVGITNAEIKKITGLSGALHLHYRTVAAPHRLSSAVLFPVLGSHAK